MSERGVFAVDRGVFEHPMFAPEPFTEREAWLWLIGQAAWRKTRVRVGNAVVELGRGECAFSVRFMASKWKWAPTRVHRFLQRLKTDTMIGTLTERGATHITICNYERYAFGRNTDKSETGTQNETQTEQRRNKEEEPKNLIPAADATRASLDFADEVMRAAGIDLEFVPPAWCGLAMRLEAVIAQGWKPDLILETVRATSGRKRDGPARSFAYFEPAIAEAHARQQAPVPTATIVPLKAEKIYVEQPRANKWAQARSSILARFGTGEDAGDGDERECGLRAGSGDGDVKLLPQG